MTLVLVSIGKPEVLKNVIDHLGLDEDTKRNSNNNNIRKAEEYFFVDPENDLYDRLDLNRGVQNLITWGTSFSFLDRFLTKGGMNELLEVLLKWNKAIYTPPKQEQALIQGGTFIFDGNTTLLAHYDESVAAHIDPESVINFLRTKEESKEKSSSSSSLLEKEITIQDGAVRLKQFWGGDYDETSYKLRKKLRLL